MIEGREGERKGGGRGRGRRRVREEREREGRGIEGSGWKEVTGTARGEGEG